MAIQEWSSPSILVFFCFHLFLFVLCFGFQGADARGHSGDGFGQVRPFAPLIFLFIINLDCFGEDSFLPAVTSEDVNLAFPNRHPRLAVGLQQRRHSGPLVALGAVGLHAEDVEASHGLNVVVAAADGVDAVLQGAHAVPAPGGDHGPLLLPHVGAVVVAQQVLPVGADLVIVASRNVDELLVDRASVAVRKPGAGTGTVLMDFIKARRHAAGAVLKEQINCN